MTAKSESDRALTHVHLTLHPDGVSVPAKRAALEATQAVGACLRAIEHDDMSIPTIGDTSAYKFEGLDLSADEYRELTQHWLLTKGFQDLTRGVRETLEEAYFYLEMIKTKPGRTNWNQVEATMARHKKSAQRLNFPQLIQRVNSGLREPMAFDGPFLSMQKLRNCLEHRGGIVGQSDVDEGTLWLTVAIPRLKFFYLLDGLEVEFEMGKPIQSNETVGADGKQPEVQIFLKQEVRTKAFGLGEKIRLTDVEFAEVAFACQMFADDVAKKLPTLPPPLA